MPIFGVSFQTQKTQVLATTRRLIAYCEQTNTLMIMLLCRRAELSSQPPSDIIKPTAKVNHICMKLWATVLGITIIFWQVGEPRQINLWQLNSWQSRRRQGFVWVSITHIIQKQSIKLGLVREFHTHQGSGCPNQVVKQFLKTKLMDFLKRFITEW